jgi:hypothetical protein
MADASTPLSWWQTIPGMLTALAALLGAVTALIVAVKDLTHIIESPEPVPAKSQVTKNIEPPLDQTEPPERKRPATRVASINGRWRDNLGFVSEIEQTGSSFTFMVQGATSCLFRPFVSTGSGSIRGRNIESTYRSSLGSQGDCKGTISSDGNSIDSRCNDSICGQIVSYSNKE